MNAHTEHERSVITIDTGRSPPAMKQATLEAWLPGQEARRTSPTASGAGSSCPMAQPMRGVTPYWKSSATLIGTTLRAIGRKSWGVRFVPIESIVMERKRV